MKKLLLMFAAVATLFTACNKDHNDGGKHDHSADIVGTWTCFTADFAEALVISADGSVVSTGVAFGEYWENVTGNIVVENDHVKMTFEDGDNFEGHFDIIPGVAFSIYNKEGARLTFNYCTNDLADEVVGMWVCNETPSAEENDMLIMNFNENGTSSFTGYFYGLDDFGANKETSYKVKGDLIIHKQPDVAVEYGFDQYTVMRMIYTPNATALGDVMSLKAYAKVGENSIETTTSWLRINQYLDLAGQNYNHIKTFVTNVKGEDKDINFMGYTFNFAKMDGSGLDKMLKSLLFAVEFPNANKLTYSYQMNGNKETYEADIEVEGNKMTIKMSENDPVFHDVVVYTFQDQDNSQMHMYMPTSSFEKFFANTSVSVMLGYGQIDKNDADAIAGVYQSVADAVHSINLSLVMSKSK